MALKVLAQRDFPLGSEYVFSPAQTHCRPRGAEQNTGKEPVLDGLLHECHMSTCISGLTPPGARKEILFDTVG